MARSTPISTTGWSRSSWARSHSPISRTPRGWRRSGSNLFLETAGLRSALVGDPGEDGLGTLRQGYLEDSSVDAVREITELIEAQRGYELNSKVITAADQMLAATTQVR
jgi:flagellar basal-body rod protein FlgG